ncbi:MAG: major capsid protein [Microviridae sp.]|nr:MAG: major capsid protein [Microviridae sp.]
MASHKGQYSFSQVPKAETPRSSFVRNHGYKTTFNAGYLIPFYVDEALPGDTFNVSASIFARLATPIVPLMDNMYLDTFFFFVPNRLLWDHWQNLMGERATPTDTTEYLVPEVDAGATGFEDLSVADYFGIPCKIPNLKVSALPFRAYNLIYNEWFRDENLQDPGVDKKDDTISTAVDYPLRRRGKRHDYFTSALPWPQKGPGVELPLGTRAPVATDAGANQLISVRNVNDQWMDMNAAAPTSLTLGSTVQADDSDGLYADLSQASAATINSLREAFQIQKLLERDARGGTRYTEILRSHFGVTSPDARLQRPEYLGGHSQPVIINPVTQTSGTATGVDTPQGNLAAYGVVGGDGNGFTKSFVEHGVIMGLVMVRADLSYQQGVNRMWSRRTRWDFYWPALSHLGEQAIYNKEIYAQAPTVMSTEPDPDNPGAFLPVNDTAFGYQERWSEYRYAPSLITGALRSNYGGTPPADTSLDSWHLAQWFTALPTLNSQFIEENPPVDRVVAVTTEPHFIFDSFFKVTAARPMPLYSVPGLIDHF